MFIKHLSKVTYVLICLLIASLILRYEFSVIKDRKLFPESEIISLDLKVDAVPSYSDGTAFFKAKPLGKAKIHNSIYVSLDHAENLDIYPGCRLSLSGIISAPDKPLNPGGYDFGEYIKSIGASLKFDSDISRVTDYTPLPPDTDRVKDGLDKELVKKIVALCIGVTVIILMCVALLYIL